MHNIEYKFNGFPPLGKVPFQFCFGIFSAIFFVAIHALNLCHVQSKHLLCHPRPHQLNHWRRRNHLPGTDPLLALFHPFSLPFCLKLKQKQKQKPNRNRSREKSKAQHKKKARKKREKRKINNIERGNTQLRWRRPIDQVKKARAPLQIWDKNTYMMHVWVMQTLHCEKIKKKFIKQLEMICIALA